MAKRMILTVQEKQKLLDIIAPHIQRLESKESGVGATMAKQAAWRTVLAEFRASCSTPVASVTQLKGIWKNLKIKAKKDVAQDRKEKKKTGGGAGFAMGSMSRMIADLLPQQMNPAIEECGLRHITHADDTHD